MEATTGRTKIFVFDEKFRRGIIHGAKDTAEVSLSAAKRLEPDGSYRINRYGRKFTIDYGGASGGYDPFFGLSGYTQLVISDLAGNQQIGIGINLISNVQNSDFFLGWNYPPYRIDVSIQLFQMVNFFQTQWGLERFRHLGAQAAFAYPLSRFKRLEAGFNFTQIRERISILTFPPML